MACLLDITGMQYCKPSLWSDDVKGRQVWLAMHVRHATGRFLLYKMCKVCPGMEQSEITSMGLTCPLPFSSQACQEGLPA